MTLVNIDLRNQGYETGPDDRVIFYSLLVREGEFGTISTAPVEVPLVDGKGSKDLAPGPVGVQIIAGQVADTRVREGRVPMEGPTTLNVVLTLLPEYSDAVRASFLAAIRGAQDEALTRIDAEVAQAVDAEVGEFKTKAEQAFTKSTAAESKSDAALSKSTTAESSASNAVSRVSALEAMGGLSPESPVDGQQANLISQPDTLTRRAVLRAAKDTLPEFFVEDFGAVGDDVIDDLPAFQSAIDAAYAANGGRVVTTPGMRYRLGGRLRVKYGTSLDMGELNGLGTLVANTSDAGIDLEAGGHVRAAFAATRSQYVGPVLELSTEKSERRFSPGRSRASYEMAIHLACQPGSIGVRLHSSSGGLAWTRGTAEVIEADYPLIMDAETGGYVNENDIQLTAMDAIDYVTASVDGVGNSQVDGNRVDVIAQTGGRPRARRIISCAGRDNIFHLRTWDFNSSSRWHPDYDGNFVHFLEGSGGNYISGNTYFGTGSGYVDRSPAARKNVIDLTDFRRTTPSRTSNLPASYSQPIMNGSEDDVFAFAADGRYAVTWNGSATPPTDNARDLFRPGGLSASFTEVSDLSIVVDMGSVIPATDLSAIGAMFSARPDYAEISASTDGASWTHILQDRNPGSVFARLDTSGVSSGRYFRLRMTCDTPRNVAVGRFFLGRKAGSTHDYGAWLPKWRPNVLDGVYVNGTRVLGPQRTGFPQPTGQISAGAFNADTATLEQIRSHYGQLLSSLRDMGILGD